jgi:hypothetical protein
MLCAVSNGAETVGVSCALSREQWEGNGGNREESNIPAMDRESTSRARLLKS